MLLYYQLNMMLFSNILIVLIQEIFLTVMTRATIRSLDICFKHCNILLNQNVFPWL